MQVTPNTTLNDLRTHFAGAGVLDRDKHIRANGNSTLYTHSLWKAHGVGSQAQLDRQNKYSAGADLVETAVRNQYGSQIADLIFAKKGRADGVQVKDLAGIAREAEALDKFRSETMKGIPVPDTGPNAPTTPAHLVVVDIYESIESYVQDCGRRNDPVKEKRVAEIINSKLEALVSQSGKAFFNDLTLADRATLLMLIDRFDLGDRVMPSGRSANQSAIVNLHDRSTKPIMASCYDKLDPKSQYNTRLKTFVDSIESNTIILQALKSEKEGTLTEDGQKKAIAEVLRLQEAAFGFTSAPYEFTTSIRSTGQYSSEDQMLRVNVQQAKSLTALLGVLCHENLHHSQYQMIDALKTNPQSLTPDERLQANIFDVESRYYVNSEFFSGAYMQQSTEIPAMHIGKQVEKVLDKMTKAL